MFSSGKQQNPVPGWFSGTMSRRAVAALGASALVPMRGLSASAQSATPQSIVPFTTRAASSHRLTIRGMTYDTGTDYTPQWGILTRQVWEIERVQREMAVIRNDLHCTDVCLYGTEIDRLIEAAVVAREEGLHVWLQPRLIEAEQDTLLDHLREAATQAERVRADSGHVALNVGVELSLFAAGIIPGASFMERIMTLLETLDELQTYNKRLNALLGEMVSVSRDAFAGPLTYGSGEWEGVDWSALEFDFLGIDLYRDAYNRDTYTQRVRGLHRHGKPVLITEFGCCTYEGAEEAGGSGYDIIDWEQDPPVLNGDYVRSEQVQAETIGELLDVFEAEKVHGAFVYTFVEVGQTYSPDARYDLDMASFGIVKTLPEDSGQGYEETGYWEPKQAFRTVGERFATDENDSR